MPAITTLFFIRSDKMYLMAEASEIYCRSTLMYVRLCVVAFIVFCYNRRLLSNWT